MKSSATVRLQHGSQVGAGLNFDFAANFDDVVDGKLEEVGDPRRIPVHDGEKAHTLFRTALAIFPGYDGFMPDIIGHVVQDNGTLKLA